MEELPKAEFGFPGRLRDKLVAAILSGAKTSTTGLMVAYERDNEELDEVGDRSAVVDSADEPVAVIETTEVRVVPVGEVDLAHCVDEGEGFTTVAAWREAHERFWHGADFREFMGDPEFTVDDSTLAVLERFRLVDTAAEPEPPIDIDATEPAAEPEPETVAAAAPDVKPEPIVVEEFVELQAEVEGKDSAEDDSAEDDAAEVAAAEARRAGWEGWLASLDPDRRAQAVRLHEQFVTLGTSDPEAWTRSELDEDRPQYVRYQVLRRLWPDTVDAWEQPGALERVPAAKRLLDAGASRAVLVQALRVAAYEAVHAVLERVDEGTDPGAPPGAPGWALIETGVDLVLPQRYVGGLHLDLHRLDPSGRDADDLRPFTR